MIPNAFSAMAATHAASKGMMKETRLLAPWTRTACATELARCVEWYKNVGKGDDSTEIPAYPPKEVVTDVLCEPNIPLPVLTRIVEAPVFAPDGTIQTAPGYHAAGRTLLRAGRRVCDTRRARSTDATRH